VNGSLAGGDFQNTNCKLALEGSGYTVHYCGCCENRLILFFVWGQVSIYRVKSVRDVKIDYEICGYL
jgi:hypothetical protein